MATCRGQMRDAIKEAGEREEDVACAYQSIEEGYREYSEVHLDMPVKLLPNREFDDGYGGVNGEPVIGFGKKYTYIKVVYDGAEWIEAVPRGMDYIGDGIPDYGGG